jgi:predicted transcriptional regulator YheO
MVSKKLTTMNNNDIKRKTSREKFLIDSLKILVDGIAMTFGSRCEVVLHDLRNLGNLEHSIIKIANGHVTGRTIGGSISDRGLRDVRGGSERDLYINYGSATKNGRLLKSSTMVIKNEKGKPIVAMCINFDVSEILNLSAAVQDVFKISEEAQQGEPAETFEPDIISTLSEITDKILRKAGKSVPLMSKEDKIEIIRQLEEQGYFLIKGAIKLIAGKLRISKSTVYTYLEHIRFEQQSSKLRLT